jgi:hypothetical protein
LQEVKLLKADTTAWVVTGLGAAVAGLGRLIGGNLGAGITGFGLAHIVLGQLDRLRSNVRL